MKRRSVSVYIEIYGVLLFVAFVLYHADAVKTGPGSPVREHSQIRAGAQPETRRSTVRYAYEHSQIRVWAWHGRRSTARYANDTRRTDQDTVKRRPRTARSVTCIRYLSTALCARDTLSETETDRETQRHRDTETQRHRDTETQRHRDTETQRHRDTETQTQREREGGQTAVD
eukprot:3940280-Rhodomonas_salina.1